jgi:hypothetical protein
LYQILSIVQRSQKAITVQVQFTSIRLDEGAEFRRIAYFVGYDRDWLTAASFARWNVGLLTFRRHDASSISAGHAAEVQSFLTSVIYRSPDKL